MADFAPLRPAPAPRRPPFGRLLAYALFGVAAVVAWSRRDSTDRPAHGHRRHRRRDRRLREARRRGGHVGGVALSLADPHVLVFAALGGDRLDRCCSTLGLILIGIPIAVCDLGCHVDLGALSRDPRLPAVQGQPARPGNVTAVPRRRRVPARRPRTTITSPPVSEERFAGGVCASRGARRFFREWQQQRRPGFS